MTHKLYQSNAQDDVLSAVREGLPIFDRENRKVGKVRYVQLGAASSETPPIRPVEFYDLHSDDQIHLLREGFVQIDCGFFNGDRFATADQIAELNDERLRLNVAGDELIAP